MMLKKALTHKLTSHVVLRDVLTARFKCHFWGKNSSTLRARKINNFYRGIPNFGIVYFKRYIFILCRKTFHFIDTLNARWCDHTWFLRRTAKHLATHATSWLLTLSPEVKLNWLSVFFFQNWQLKTLLMLKMLRKRLDGHQEDFQWVQVWLIPVLLNR